jgi:hypothetical protein
MRFRSSILLSAVYVAACGSPAERDGFDPGSTTAASPSEPVSGFGPGAAKDASTGTSAAEVCGNGLDDNRDGHIDENCPCAHGATQACYPGDPAEVGRGICKKGTQTCIGSNEFSSWGPCEGAVGPAPETCDTVDNDCNGPADDGLIGCKVVSQGVNLDGDCVTAKCPAEAPYAIGCNISMSGADARGCIASTPGGSGVFFKEGDKCGVGKVTGTLLCSTQQGPGLDASNCNMNKTTKFYPAGPSGCPQ